VTCVVDLVRKMIESLLSERI